jgi:hypothetical protein
MLSRLRLPPLLQMPKWGTTKDWRQWETRARAEHPIRYWLQETLWKTRVRRSIRRRIGKAQDLWWALQYRCNPTHRYHVLNTGLNPGPHQLRDRQLHAMFHSFSKFYEHHASANSHADWQADEPHAKAFAEMEVLYRWWHQERPARIRSLRKMREDHAFRDPVLKDDFLAVFDEDFRDHPEVVAWREASRKRDEMERQGQDEDQHMLHRLVDLRLFFWD